ncbi:hypothetical protein QYE76_041572 [Lolium multiflorum]|uniref:Retrotransposon gag domain-containing protein n=1 Tax=Lolium multiflorum TaxID=4521 RepID=A0AAD8TDM8_LOLMU|nr:hypothetical protein QYE76_041572 [Lolium multiflorum]
MGKPRDTKIAILPSTTRKGTTLSTSAALDSPSVISKLVSPPQASNAGTSAESENSSHNCDDASAVLDNDGSLGSFLDATIARSRQIENTETPNENAATPVNSPESVEYSSDDLDEDYVELDDDFIEKCNATTDARKIKNLLAEHAVRYKLSPDPKFATSPININDKDYDFSLDLSHIAIVEKTPFCGTEKESAVEHMIELSTLSSVFSDDVKMRTYFVAKIFPFSLKDDAKTWYNNLPPGSIKSPKELLDVFFRKYFPASAQHIALQRIYNFDQEDGEKLPEAWARFCSLIRARPDHDLEKHDLLDIFYSGLTIESRAYLDSCAGCVFRKRTPDDAEELLAKIGRNHDDWSTPEPTPTPIVKKRGMIKLNDEDMREAKKSLKEKGIKPEDVKNLPPIEDLCEITPPSSMIEDPLYPEGHPKRVEQDSQLIKTSAPSKKKKKKHKNVVESSEPVNDPNSISISDAETESGNEHDKDNDKDDTPDKEEVEKEPEKHAKNKKYTKEDFIAEKHAIRVPRWGSCEKVRGTPRELSNLYTMICNGRSFSDDGEVAEETPVTYEELSGELKKKYDEVKAALEADLIGSFHRTRSHGIRWKGFTPEGALDGVDLSTPSEERTRSLRQEINFMVAHSLHRHSESLVNTLERVALRVIQEIMSHQYSPSGPALGTHQGELLLQSRPPLPFALAAPEAPNSSAYVVYKIGGDPSDYQFLQDAPKEIPHGYACAYVPDCSTWAPSNQVAIAGTSGATGGTSEADPEKQTWLAKYATPTKLPSPAPAVGSEPEKQAWLVKYATPTNLQGSAPAAITADQICTILKDQFGMMPKRKAIGYTKPYPNEYELIPLPPKYRLPDFTKFSGSDGSSSIEHVSRYLAQLGMISASDELRVSEKEAVELAVVGLSSSIKDVASQADYPSLAHMVQKLSAYEQRHPDVYQDKFKRVVTMVDAAKMRSLRENKRSRWLSGLELQAQVWRQQIQMAIENGRLIFNQYAMKVDTHPFPAVNMVEFAHLRGCQPDFSANINMVELGHRSEKDGDEDSCSQSKDTEGAAPCDRLRQDGKRYVTEGEVKNIRYQRPLSDHLLNKYVSRYDQRRRHGDDDERGRMARNDRRHRRHNHDEERQERHAREQDDTDRHWDCPFFRHCWDSGMSRLPTIGNCPECNQKKKEAANVSVFERLGPLPPQNRRAETPLLEDLEDSEDEGEDEEDRYHRPRWCPDGLSHSQKRRVQRLRGLEEAERLYLHTLRKARPDLAAKVQRTLDEEGLPQRKEWRPKQRKADDETSAGTNMVLVRPAKCRAPRSHDAPEVDNSKRTNVIKSEIGLVLSTGLGE